jgi:hypothetical protein
MFAWFAKRILAKADYMDMGYVDVNDYGSACLDGHFTARQLDAIATLIRARAKYCSLDDEDESPQQSVTDSIDVPREP